MIITKLYGGLGNQMFQYAAGLSLAKRTGQKLKLDITALSNYSLHQNYQFDKIFNHNFEIASKLDCLMVLKYQYKRGVHGSIAIAPNHKYGLTRTLIRQNTFNYWEGFERLKGSKYLAGYWQSEKYFRFAKDDVYKHFNFKEFEKETNTTRILNIKKENSVFIHIRRGDYVSDPKTKEFHGICGYNYYKSAIKLIKKNIDNPLFFIFSDDPEEAKRIIGESKNIDYIQDNQGLYSYNDLHLMSHCRHHILANSSFSWWGAWLSRYRYAKKGKQITIAPDRWLLKANEEIEDIYNPEWIKLKDS